MSIPISLYVIQEHLPSNSLNIQVPKPNGSQIGDTVESPKMVLLGEKLEKSWQCLGVDMHLAQVDGGCKFTGGVNNFV